VVGLETGDDWRPKSIRGVAQTSRLLIITPSPPPPSPSPSSSSSWLKVRGYRGPQKMQEKKPPAGPPPPSCPPYHREALPLVVECGLWIRLPSEHRERVKDSGPIAPPRRYTSRDSIYICNSMSPPSGCILVDFCFYNIINIEQKVRKFVFGRLFLCCNNASLFPF